MTKTTLELSEDLYRDVKARAVRDGTSVRLIVAEALRGYLSNGTASFVKEPAWMEIYGSLRDISDEVERVQAVIDEEFSKVDAEGWE